MDNFNFIKRKEKKHSIDNCQFSSLISNHLDKRLPIYSHWLSSYFLLSPRINQRRRERKRILFFFFSVSISYLRIEISKQIPSVLIHLSICEIRGSWHSQDGTEGTLFFESSSYFHLQLTRRVDLPQYFTIDWNEFGDEDGDQGNLVTGNNLKQENINVKLYFLISKLLFLINSKSC